MSFAITAVDGFTALGQWSQGQAAKSTAYTQADGLDYEAAQAKQYAIEQAAIIRRAGRQAVGTAATSYAASGVRVDSGSAMDVQAQIQTDVAHDAYQTILDGDRRANSLQAQATMTRIKGRQAATAANIGAVSTLLQGGAKSMGGWATGYNYNGDASGGQYSSSGASIMARR